MRGCKVNLHRLFDRLAANAEGLGLAHAGQDCDIIKFINRMFEAQPFDMPPRVGAARLRFAQLAGLLAITASEFLVIRGQPVASGT